MEHHSCLMLSYFSLSCQTAILSTYYVALYAFIHVYNDSLKLFVVSDLNTCRHKPCLNNGLCVNNEPDNYTCICNKGFSGRNCQIGELNYTSFFT